MPFGSSARRVLSCLALSFPLTAAGHALAQGQIAAAPDKPGMLSAADLSERVWSKALASTPGADADLVFDPIRSIPSDAASPALSKLRSLPELYDQNRTKQQSARLEKIAALEKELNEALAKPETNATLSASLKAAIEWSMVAIDKSTVLTDARVTGVVERADRAARAAENAGDWLTSSELFYRLNLLMDEAGTYRDDVKRLSHRLTLLRVFVPERLWSLRNNQRTGEGKDPLPAFNALGEDYRNKMRGITRDMVQAAIERSAREHVDRSKLNRKDLLLGGLDFIRTLVTTSDLEPVFPAVADVDAKGRMLQFLDEKERKLKLLPGKLSSYELTDTISDLLRANAESVNIPESALLHEFGEGAMAKLDDFSAVIWPDDLARFERMYQGKLKGVGVQIQMDEATQMIKVVTPLEGTPAQRAGIRPGDLIKKVGGQSAVGISLNQAVELITGQPGTHVVVTMERDGKEIDFDLVRAVIPLRSVKGWQRQGPRDDQWDWFIDPESKIGYVRILQFSEDTTRELDGAIREMKASGLNGLVVDLRFNPGGLLTQAVSIANFFIDHGTIVSTTGDNAVEQANPGRAKLKGIPIAMLINEGSASASEIVAGAVRHYADKGEIRAVLIGDRSYGKGSVQNVFDIAPNAQMKLTTQYYKLPGGQIIHRLPGAKAWGVEPHVRCFMLPDQISQSLTLRQDADVVQIDEKGNAVLDEKRPDPKKLLTDGVDLQLEYALVLLQSQTVSGEVEQAQAAPAAEGGRGKGS